MFGHNAKNSSFFSQSISPKAKLLFDSDKDDRDEFRYIFILVLVYCYRPYRYA